MRASGLNGGNPDTSPVTTDYFAVQAHIDIEALSFRGAGRDRGRQLAASCGKPWQPSGLEMQ